MTILIKGMEMPKNCDDCFLDNFYCEMCQHVDGYQMTGGRPHDCPLMEQKVGGRLWGRWEKVKEYPGFRRCSVCHDCYILEEDAKSEPKWNYCPQCGAELEADE